MKKLTTTEVDEIVSKALNDESNWETIYIDTLFKHDEAEIFGVKIYRIQHRACSLAEPVTKPNGKTYATYSPVWETSGYYLDSDRLAGTVRKTSELVVLSELMANYLASDKW